MAEARTISLSMIESDIALLTFDMPGKGANVLSTPVLEELASHLDQLCGRQGLAGLIITSGKPGTFIAGADLREFVASFGIVPQETAEMCRRGQNLFRRLSSECPFVTVAAIDGSCMGGGAELASWCDRRVVSDNPKTEIGFPEVKLGLFPGWGGTVRMPRIVGLGNAVEMISSGEPIDAASAVTMEWASDRVPADQLMRAAIDVVRAEQESGQFRRDRERWNGPVGGSETEIGFLGATASAYIQQQTKGHYPAPMAALEVLLGGATADIDTACQMEAEGVGQLFGSPINAALVNIFFLTDRNKKDPGVDRKGVSTQTVSSVATIGAGIMGAGIAAANARRSVPVTMTDADPNALARGIQAVMQEVAYNRATKSADVERAVELAPLVNATTSDAEIASRDLVIEAVVENAEVKKQIYARIEPQMKPEAILASNTSTIPISLLAADLRRPAKFCGIHFFNPVRRMKLVEVIRGEKTSDETVATAVAYAKMLGKSPIVVNDGPGFLVNRLLLPYMNEALDLISEGAAIRDVERAAKTFGMPMGPITLYDMVGIDTAVFAGQTMQAAFPDRISASPILPEMVKAGRLGQKSGLGFFSYRNKKKRPEPDPDLTALLEPHVQKPTRNSSQEELTSRLFLPMLLEATRVLDEKIVRDVRDVDLGLIFGIGFPPFKGGLLFWADTLGAKKIIEMLKPLDYLGPRTEPTPMLLDMAKTGQKFYH